MVFPTKGLGVPSDPRWMASSVITHLFHITCSHARCHGSVTPSPSQFSEDSFFCNDKTKNYKNCYRIYFPLQQPIKIIKETIFFKKVRKNENILRNKDTTLVFGSSRLIIVHLPEYPTFRKRKWRRLEDKTNLSIFCKEALEKTPSKLCWKDLKDCVMAHQDNLLRFRIMK